MSDKTIVIRADFNMCDEFPTKKSNFNKLCNELRKKGYTVKDTIYESMGSVEVNDIIITLGNNDYKIFTSSDPYAKDAIMDSNLYIRIPDVIEKIEKVIKSEKLI